MTDRRDVPARDGGWLRRLGRACHGVSSMRRWCRDDSRGGNAEDIGLVRPPVESFHHRFDGAVGLLAGLLAHRGEVDVCELCEQAVVVSGDGKITGDIDAGTAQPVEDPDRDAVIGTDHSGGQVGTTQQFLRRGRTSVLGVVTLDQSDDCSARDGASRVDIRFADQLRLSRSRPSRARCGGARARRDGPPPQRCDDRRRTAPRRRMRRRVADRPRPSVAAHPAQHLPVGDSGPSSSTPSHRKSRRVSMTLGSPWSACGAEHHLVAGLVGGLDNVLNHFGVKTVADVDDNTDKV